MNDIQVVNASENVELGTYKDAEGTRMCHSERAQ